MKILMYLFERNRIVADKSVPIYSITYTHYRHDRSGRAGRGVPYPA